MSETVQPAPPRPRASRWLWGGLIASLALNCLLIGIIASATWSWHRHGGAPPGIANAARFVRGMPSERREEIRGAVRADLAEMRTLRAASRSARSEVRQALAKEPFDGEAYAAAQRRLLDADQKLREQGSRILLKTVKVMTPQERQQLAEAEAWRERRWGGKRGRRGSDDAEPPRQ